MEPYKKFRAPSAMRRYPNQGYSTAKPRNGRRGGKAAYYARRRRQFRVGYDRTSGYYGRYTSGGEMKFKDTSVADGTVTAAVTVAELTVIPEGNGEQERVGRKITIKRVHMTGALTLGWSVGAANTSERVLCYIVQDRQTNGAVFSATDLLDADGIDNFLNLANSSRFKILAKKTYILNVGGAAPSGAAYIFGEDIVPVEFHLKVNIPMEYDNSATTGVVTTVRSNNIYFVTQSQTGLLTSLVGNVRLRYSDH